MDNFPDGVSAPDLTTLSYDESVPYESQVPTHPSNDPERATLLNRIGNTKVYLLSDTAQARFAKRKHTEGDDDDDVDMEEETTLTLRANALLLTGTPISHLPTTRIFAYATHFDTHPIALEWLDDNSCILVYESTASARTAHRYLQKSATEDMDADGFITAKPIPITIWPPEERITKSLGKGQGLKGVIRMRWAKVDDVKKKGAKKESEFYKKYGKTAGKEDDGGEVSQKRRRRDDPTVRSRLDDDAFLGADRPSKMRSDYVGGSCKTMERTSSASNSSDLKNRISAPLPRRARGQFADRLAGSPTDTEEDWRRARGRGRRIPRPHRTQQDLDDELDVFLNEKE
ncbi:uncharacterized protein BJ212DRAFT_1375107 [Suillus subaureus]|uniref:Chromatin target of PRMT1 protein C-terminal domain-containing protein n=1 Tax=Suillus subaureus TaxID=48587 RepID=A0A9P7E4L9_9AGAM|nr:uncharacterized protein BJ212DRAFT_1375107 [Suillus subaureus]KAG1811135.1 hypothetical protein BJ212DRAFT_1375107 [Suillus subaureus]